MDEAVERAIRALREALAAIREGELTIAEIIIEDKLRELERYQGNKPWCWP
jgi:hypothetical protein